MSASLRSARSVACLAAALCALSSRSAAADNAGAAREAYNRGAAAFTAKRYAEAANELARADALAPNPVALASALKAAELADDAVLAMTLADRAEQRPGAGEAALTAARRVREALGARVGKLSVRCAVVRSCAVTVDADPFPVEQQRWVNAGAHAIEISAGATVTRHTVTIEGGKSLDFHEPSAGPSPTLPPAREPAATPIEKPIAPPPARGISPAWFWIGAGLTAASGGVLIWSGVDTLGQHDDYYNRRTLDPASGQAAQTRTNVLVGVTSALGVATAALGIFAVRWSSREPAATALSVGPGGFTIRQSF